MPAFLPKLAIIILGSSLLVVFLAMLQAWAWALSLLLKKRPLWNTDDHVATRWTWKTVILVGVTWFILQAGVVGIFVVATKGIPANPPAAGQDHKPDKPSAMSPAELMMITMAFNGLVVVFIPLVLRSATPTPLKDLGIDRNQLARRVLAGVVGFLLVTPLVYGVNLSSSYVWRTFVGKPDPHPLEKMVRSEFTGTIALVAFLSAVILAPAAEELIFRGILQSWFAKLLYRKPRHEETVPIFLENLPVPEDPQAEVFSEEVLLPETQPSLETSSDSLFDVITEEERPHDEPEDSPASRKAAIVLTSLLFALVHLPQWPAPVAIFFLALALGWLYDRTGSLIAPFIMHALFNGLATIGLFYSVLLPEPAKGPAKPAPASQQSARPHTEKKPLLQP